MYVHINSLTSFLISIRYVVALLNRKKNPAKMKYDFFFVKMTDYSYPYNILTNFISFFADM